jgi:hypothetical protein
VTTSHFSYITDNPIVLDDEESNQSTTIPGSGGTGYTTGLSRPGTQAAVDDSTKMGDHTTDLSHSQRLKTGEIEGRATFVISLAAKDD